MKRLIYNIKKMDWLMIGSAVLLSILGILSIYSSSIQSGDFLNLKKQVIFLVVGVALMFMFSFLDWRSIRDNPYLILILYIICCAALLGLLLFGPVTRGIRGWYKFGSIAIDPIEAVKIILVIILAKYFSVRHVEMYKLKHIILSGLYVFVPAFLIFRQPDLGSVIILVVLWIGILIISGIKLRHFLILFLCGAIITVFGWFFLLKDYQKERIISFAVPQVEPLGISWSQNQSKIAIGSGGMFGQGLGKGSQTQFGFLPEPHTDFIFSAIAEEFGFIGIMAVFILFLILIWRILKVATRSRSNFCRLFASGYAIIIVTQIFIHVGMNVGFSPVIGIPLPFVSYGGAGLLSFFIGMGIIQSSKINS